MTYRILFFQYHLRSSFWIFVSFVTGRILLFRFRRFRNCSLHLRLMVPKESMAISLLHDRIRYQGTLLGWFQRRCCNFSIFKVDECVVVSSDSSSQPLSSFDGFKIPDASPASLSRDVSFSLSNVCFDSSVSKSDKCNSGVTSDNYFAASSNEASSSWDWLVSCRSVIVFDDFVVWTHVCMELEYFLYCFCWTGGETNIY